MCCQNEHTKCKLKLNSDATSNLSDRQKSKGLITCSVGQAVGKRYLHTFLMREQVSSTPTEAMWQFLSKARMHTPFDPVIIRLTLMQMNLSIHVYMNYNSVVIAKDWR